MKPKMIKLTFNILFPPFSCQFSLSYATKINVSMLINYVKFE